MNRAQKHFRNTARLVGKLKSGDVATWLIESGYYPEPYVLPPSFDVISIPSKRTPYCKDLANLKSRELVSVSFPKTLLTEREFSIQHPWIYYDIVHWFESDWAKLLCHLFDPGLRIYSYSIPIPVDANHPGRLGPLRSGRMIYEWIEMAERDLVAEAHSYKYIARADISNFYSSVYTHSIAWSLHGRDDAINDQQSRALVGSKIDKLVQYANNKRTNGLPVGSALSDMIAELILARADMLASSELEGVDFIATRFKDDYRILCHSEDDAQSVLAAIARSLRAFNLHINERKTCVLRLPEGLYRAHDREYFIYSLRDSEIVPFKTFEHTALKVLDIHRQYPGTSIIEKFLNELFTQERNLKLALSSKATTRAKQIESTISLLFLMKKESQKILALVLAIIDELYSKHSRDSGLKEYLQMVIRAELEQANACDSVFETVWLVWFWRYVQLGNISIDEIVNKKCIRENEFVKSIVASKQLFYKDTGWTLFCTPKSCRSKRLAERMNVFERIES